MLAHLGRIVYVTACVLAAIIVVYSFAALFTPISWEIFPADSGLVVIPATIVAMVIWGVGRTIYFLTGN